MALSSVLFLLLPTFSDADSVVNLETTVVSANRTEQRIENATVSIDVLPQRLLTSKSNSRIEQVIQMSPGVTIQDGQANIRSGSGWSLGAGSRVLLLVDDLPVLSPDAGGAIWNAMPMEAIEQIEIVKGAASSLYGSSALNGVIHLRTWEPSDEMRIHVNTMTEIYDQAKINSLNWSNQLRGQGAIRFAYSDSRGENNKHGWVFHGQALNDQGFQYLVGDESIRVHGKYRYKPSNNFEIGVNANVWSSDRSSSLIWEDFRFGYTPLDSSATVTQSNLGSINGYLKIRNGRLLQTIRSRWLGFQNISGLDTNNYDNSANTGHLEYLLQLFQNKNWTYTSGLLISSNSMESPLFSGSHSSGNQAIFFQMNGNFKKFDFTGGARWENYGIDGLQSNKPVFRFGGHYQVLKGTHFRTSFAQGYRFPSVAEMYSSSSAGELKVFPNPNIRPESGWTGEVGFKQLYKFRNLLKGYLDVAFFQTRFNEMMEFTFGKWDSVPNATLSNYGFTSLNVGPTRIMGIETILANEINFMGFKIQSFISHTYSNPISINPDLVYQYDVDGEEMSYTSTSLDPSRKMLKYRYRNIIKGDMEMIWKNFSVGLSLRYNSFMENIDAIFTDPLISIYVPGVQDSRYYMNNGDLFFDIRAQYRFNKDWKAQIGILNLMNRLSSPRPALLSKPRSLMFQISYELN